MDNNKKLVEGLLRADGIDPAGPGESERVAFGKMLDGRLKSKGLKSGLRRDRWRMIMHSKITKFAAAAAMVAIAVLIGINFFSGTPAWAQVVHAFNEVKNLHVSAKFQMPDGTYGSGGLWIRVPDCIRQDSPEEIVIDNGTQRLSIDKIKQEAQFSESLIEYKSPAEHHMLKGLGMFKDGGGEYPFEIEFLPEESNSTELVYSLKIKDDNTPSGKGKAWVCARTMLPKRVVIEVAKVTNSDQIADIRSGKVVPEYMNQEYIFDYEPIADDVFALEVPQGYTELPFKQRDVMSGRVLDENEEPVANAIVYATDRAGQFAEQTTTDGAGQFTFTLPPDGAGKAPVWLPVLFRAFVEGVPDKVAWSIINDPANRHEPGSGWEPGGSIPYEVGSVEIDGCMLRSASGITLRMEPAGLITGRVTDVNGAAITDASVKLLSCQLSDKHGNAGLFGVDVYKWSGANDELGVVQTDGNGWYELANLPQLWKRTEVFVRAEAEGFAGDTTNFYLKGPMEHQEVDFLLYQNNLTVTGRLIDNYGKPIEKTPIYAMVNGKGYGSVWTNNKGAFEIKCPNTPDLQIKAELSYNRWSPYEKEKHESFIYYPDVIAGIDYQQGRLEYEIEMTAELPEFVLNVEARDTAGDVVKFFPAEIRGDGGPILPPWQTDMDLTQLTDENGRCTFRNVPNVPGLKVTLCRNGKTSLREKLTDSEKIIAEESYEKYLYGETAVEVVEGQKEYDLTIVVFKLGEQIDYKKSQK